jgi:hypothetical protein
VSATTRSVWLLPLLLALASLCGAPFAACGVVFAVPGMANERFISANDGSTGPAFDLWVGSMLSVAIVGLVVSGALLAYNLTRSSDPSAR